MARALTKRLFATGDTCPLCKCGRLGGASRVGGHRRHVVRCLKCNVGQPADVRRCENYQLAELLAADLFTDGDGRKAARLVSEHDDGRLGGGWCEGAVVDRLADLLDERGPR